MRVALCAALRSATAVRMSACVNSSSMMTSGFMPSASRNSSSDSTSTSTGMPGADARAWRMAALIEPAAMMWFSLTSTMSCRPMRWLRPPPQRTAYFCARRRPGSVLRVSRIWQPVPATAVT